MKDACIILELRGGKADYGGAAVGTLRRSGIFTAVCCAFGLGAALGALTTKDVPDLALGLPVVALLIVLLRCEVAHSKAKS